VYGGEKQQMLKGLRISFLKGHAYAHYEWIKVNLIFSH